MHELLFLTSAKRDFAKIDKVYQKIIKEKLLLLCNDPDSLKNNIKALKGKHKDKFRLRVNNYRIVYKKDGKKLIIVVISIGHRKDIYK